MFKQIQDRKPAGLRIKTNTCKTEEVLMLEGRCRGRALDKSERVKCHWLQDVGLK